VSRPPRPRRQRREQERALQKQVERAERAAAELPGGAPDRPIEVTSAAVVDTKARAVPCVRCGGSLEPRGDRASSTPRGVLREIELACRQCHGRRTLWFRIAPPAAN
jgi:hypothetical protein